jgi:exodeoxyribonuclease VII large subunit
LLALPRQRLDHAAAALRRALRANAHIHRVSFSQTAGRLSPHLLRTNVERRRERYAGIAVRLRASAAANLEAYRTRIAREHERVRTLARRAGLAIDNSLEARWARCERDAQLLAAFSYRSVLARGFTLVRDKSGRPMRTAAGLAIGAPIGIEFADGSVSARVEAVQTTPRQEPARPRRRRDPGPGQGSLF